MRDQNELLVMRQNGWKRIGGDPDTIRKEYVKLEAELDLGVQQGKTDHIVAFFRYNAAGDLLEGMSIQGPL